MTDAPALASCYFPRRGEPTWTRLALVLRHTARLHCPDWSIDVHPLPSASDGPHWGRIANTRKLSHWLDVVRSASLGQRLLLIDADTFIVRPLDPVWDWDFDVAYTTKRPTARFPFNGGVVFLRVSSATVGFMEAWNLENLAMMQDPKRFAPWHAKFGGVNQAALGALLADGRTAGLQLRSLPCLEWNCEDSEWAHFDPAITRIVHMKSSLQLEALGPIRTLVTPPHRQMIDRWKAYERQALAPHPVVGPLEDMAVRPESLTRRGLEAR